jgi:O-antigen/teichoic acid export membrane protein
LIGDYLEVKQLGEYSVAIRLIEFFAFIPSVVYTSAAPIIAEAKSKNEDLYQRKLSDLYKLMFFLWILTAIPILAFGRMTIDILYGKQFELAGALFSLSAFRLFFTNIGTARAVFIVNENLFQFSLITVLIGCVSNIGLNFILIPIYGVWGSFTATIISYILSIFVCDLFLKKTRINLKLIIQSFALWKGLTSIKFNK